MPAPRQHSALVQVARLYYLDGLSQGEVARELGISRSSVSRMLAEARDKKIVEIRIHPEGPLARNPDLERRLMEFGALDEAFVVLRPPGRSAMDVVSELAARVIESRLHRLTSIGLSWGSTVARIVDEMLVDPIHQGIHLYPLVGGMPTLGTGPSGNEAIERLARKGQMVQHRFDAPAIVESEVTWRALREETSIRRAIADAGSVGSAIVGIGSTGVHASPHVVQAMHLSPEELAAFHAQRPVGDICGQFYDADGRLLGAPTLQRVVGIGLEQLAAIPRVMGVAGGHEKARGVAGAIRTGVLNLIVMDEGLASEVVALLQS